MGVTNSIITHGGRERRKEVTKCGLGVVAAVQRAGLTASGVQQSMIAR
jgi:hypothetical protein